MAFSGRTYEATVVTTRQWVGHKLATWAMGSAFFAAVFMSLDLLWNHEEIELQSWVYVDSSRWAYPPLALWVGLGVYFFSAATVRIDAGIAIRNARGHGFGLVPRSERQSVADATENLKRQLHERGHARLFASGNGTYVRLGLGLVGVGLVLMTSLFTPTTITIGGVAIDSVQKGALPLLCLAASAVALVTLPLSFPFGRSHRVVVDSLGNLSDADEPAVPPVGQTHRGTDVRADVSARRHRRTRSHIPRSSYAGPR